MDCIFILLFYLSKYSGLNNIFLTFETLCWRNFMCMLITHCWIPNSDVVGTYWFVHPYLLLLKGEVINHSLHVNTWMKRDVKHCIKINPNLRETGNVWTVTWNFEYIPLGLFFSYGIMGSLLLLLEKTIS